MRSALVIGDGWQSRNVLAAVRGLAVAGWHVGVGSPERGLAGSSRFASWHRLPSATADLEAFVDALAPTIRAGRYEVVFAGGDAEVMALTASATRLPAVVPHSDHNVVRTTFDKGHLASLATDAGLAVPQTIIVERGQTVHIDSPVIVKPRLHWTPGKDLGPGRVEAVRAADTNEALKAIERIHAVGGEAVLQEVLPGSPTAYVGLLDQHGGVITEWQQDGRGTWPADAGVWTRAEIVALDPELALRCRTLLRAAGWFGLAQLQFIRDQYGTPRLIDFNGRFYASGALPLAAGINVADLWARAALGMSVTRPPDPPVGMRYQWLEGDLLRGLHERRGGLVHDLADCARYRFGSVHSVWSARDPRPAVELLFRRLRRGSVQRVGGRLVRAIRG